MLFNVVVSVRVWMTQFGKQRSFQRFHLFSFFIFYMVVTQKMQAAMNHQMRPVGL